MLTVGVLETPHKEVWVWCPNNQSDAMLVLKWILDIPVAAWSDSVHCYNHKFVMPGMLYPDCPGSVLVICGADHG